MDEPSQSSLITNIKKEKVTPERELPKETPEEVENKLDRILSSNLFGDDREEGEIDDDDKKNIEPTKTSDELLEELFGAIGASIFIPDILAAGSSGDDQQQRKEKKSKKKKRKHSDNESDTAESKQHKKSKKLKKVKQEKEDALGGEPKAKKIKKEKKDKDKEKDKDKVKTEKSEKHSSSIKKEKSDDKSKLRVSRNGSTTTERHKLSIVIKDLKVSSEIVKTLNRVEDKKKSSTSSSDKRKRRSGEREKSNSRRKNDDSDLSLSDEETYRRMLEYHTSARWFEEQQQQNASHRRRTRSRSRERVRDWDRDKYRSARGRSRDDDRFNARYPRRRSHSRSKSARRSPIDKKKLLEIARRNAISMLRNGALPRNISDTTKEKLMQKIRHGGKSIEELTNYCKKLSKAEDLGELSELSDSDNDAEGRAKVFHHPFEVKDRGPIVMNIRNAIPIMPKSNTELKAIMAQFPVSSGKHHSKIENTWIPVTTTSTSATSTTTSSTTATTVANAPKTVMTLEKQIQEQLPELAQPRAAEPKPLNPVLARPYNWKSDDHYMSAAIVPELAPPPPPPVDVSDIISQRLNAMKKLQENPNDFHASQVLQETQQNMSQWAQSKYTPGQFLGSTDVRVLTAKELAGGSQAWARKNQLIDTQPVASGMGMHLLKKMGWNPGEGLGKEKTGSLEPLLLELKLDKRGLEANEEILRQQNKQKGFNNKKGPGGGGGGGRGGPGANQRPLANLDQKHPVSLLGELSSKRKWGAPAYDLIFESGPAHAKNFIFKVRLNGIEYSCPQGANNKKEAKSAAAKFCLQQLGILPT